MMKLTILLVAACLLVVCGAQNILLPSLGYSGYSGYSTYQQELTSQSHAPWSASAISRSQFHGPDGILAAAPIAYQQYLRR